MSDEITAAFLRGALGLVATDTVYGLAAALDSPEGVAALYAVKGRDRSQPCQVLIFDPDVLIEILAPLPPVLRDAVNALVPGPVTCIVPDEGGRFAAAAGDQTGSVGLRVPLMSPPVPIPIALVATSANEPGDPDPARITDIPETLRRSVQIVIDRGELFPTPSAVVDLRPLADGGAAILIRSGAAPERVRAALSSFGIGCD